MYLFCPTQLIPPKSMVTTPSFIVYVKVVPLTDAGKSFIVRVESVFCLLALYILMISLLNFKTRLLIHSDVVFMT
jgi:hypothetical protein